MNRTKPIDNRTTQELVVDQFLILSGVIDKKLSIVTRIHEGYNKNEPVLINNGFLHYIARMLYRSLIIDFAALFGKSKDDKNRLHLLCDKQHKQNISSIDFERIQFLLNKYKPSIEPVKEIIRLRNKEVAHYDLLASEHDGVNRVSIGYNLNYVEELNELFIVAKEVITLASSGESGFGWGSQNQKLRGLENTIAALLKV